MRASTIPPDRAKLVHIGISDTPAWGSPMPTPEGGSPVSVSEVAPIDQIVTPIP